MASRRGGRLCQTIISFPSHGSLSRKAFFPISQKRTLRLEGGSDWLKVIRGKGEALAFRARYSVPLQSLVAHPRRGLLGGSGGSQGKEVDGHH
jgi:hypothetical protein